MSKPPILSAWPDYASMCRGVAGEDSGTQQAMIRAWCRYDPAAFCVTALPLRFTSTFNRLHLDWFAYPKMPYTERNRAYNYAVAAPRGAAKSTVISFADVMHDICYGLEAFVGIVSNVSSLAEELVGDIYHTLKIRELAPELHDLYGPFSVSGTKTSFVVHCPYGLPGGTKVQAYSMRSTVRGHKHAGVRFTKMIVDDGEHPDRVRQPANRDADQQHIEKDLMRAGEPGLVTIMAGTVLCQDSVLQRYLDPGSGGSWEQKHFKSLIKWPDERTGKWEEARQVWADLSLGGANARREALDVFYQANRAELDRGAVVLWPDRRPLIDLMVSSWENPRSFFAEDQNEPQESTEITFDVDRFHYVSFDGERITRDDGTWVALSSCRVRGWWDPIPFRAKNTGRDEAGWAVTARCPNGGRYVLHASGFRGTPDEQWEHTFELMRMFPTSRWGYENNTGGLDDNPDWRAALSRQGLRGRIRGYQTAASKKEERIAELQPSTANGFLRFSRTDVAPNAYAQFRQFPYGRHDDLIDAIERACYLSAIDNRSMTITRAPA